MEICVWAAASSSGINCSNKEKDFRGNMDNWFNTRAIRTPCILMLLGRCDLRFSTSNFKTLRSNFPFPASFSKNYSKIHHPHFFPLRLFIYSLFFSSLHLVSPTSHSKSERKTEIPSALNCQAEKWSVRTHFSSQFQLILHLFRILFRVFLRCKYIFTVSLWRISIWFLFSKSQVVVSFLFLLWY